MTKTPPECTYCARPATKFPEGYDECCDMCFADRFEQCASCDAWALKDEIGTVETMPATRMDPAEYEKCCVRCRPEDDSEPDMDDKGEWE